jgi:hypothetical protein
MKKPPDWKTFLANEENKKQLIELLCRVWSTYNFAPITSVLSSGGGGTSFTSLVEK